MSRARAYIFASVIFLLGAGGYLAASWWIVRESATLEIQQEREFGELRDENRQLKVRPASGNLRPIAATSSAPATKLPADPAPRAKIASDLIRSGLLGKVRWPDPFLNSLPTGMTDFAEFIGLSPGEKSALLQTLEAGEREFAAAVLAHATVVRSGSTVTITLNEQPQVRAAYDRMLQGIASVLGPERYGYYESSGAKAAFERIFDKWGLKAFAISVDRSNGGPSGKIYQVRGSVSTQRDSIDFHTNSVESVELNIGPVAALIPADL